MVSTALVVVLAMLGSACSDDDDEAAVAECRFEGSLDAQEAVSDPEGRFTLVGADFEVVEPGCEEQLVFRLEPSDGGDLNYSVTYRAQLAGPSGTIGVAGEEILEVVLQEASGDAAMQPPQLPAAAVFVTDIVRAPEVPGGAIWAIGLAGRPPFDVRVEEADDQVLLVVAVGAAAER